MKKSGLTFARLAAAALAALSGAAYLWFGSGVLAFALPAMGICFLAVAAISVREAKAAGLTGFAAWLPALAALFAAAFALLGCAAYFTQR